MPFFSNRDINRLGLQAATGTLASALSYVFSAVFLLHAGLTPAQIFLSFAAIPRAAFCHAPRPPRRRAGHRAAARTHPGDLSWRPRLPSVRTGGRHRPGSCGFVAIAAMGQVFYCTSYHVFFTVLGDADHRGSQVGAVQALGRNDRHGCCAMTRSPVVGAKNAIALPARDKEEGRGAPRLRPLCGARWPMGKSPAMSTERVQF
jgi:hypothetical protein